MKWAKRSEYHAVSDCGSYKVAKHRVKDQEIYCVSYLGVVIAWEHSKQSAQKAAQQHKDAR